LTHCTVEPGIKDITWHPLAAVRSRGCELPETTEIFRAKRTKKIVWRRNHGVNGKAPQAVVVVLQSCGKRAAENDGNAQTALGMNREPGSENALLADSQRGSKRKEKADTCVVKDEECASVSTAEDSHERNARV